jgi:predicted secreted protein
MVSVATRKGVHKVDSEDGETLHRMLDEMIDELRLSADHGVRRRVGNVTALGRCLLERV